MLYHLPAVNVYLYKMFTSSKERHFLWSHKNLGLLDLLVLKLWPLKFSEIAIGLCGGTHVGWQLSAHWPILPYNTKNAWTSLANYTSITDPNALKF